MRFHKGKLIYYLAVFVLLQSISTADILHAEDVNFLKEGDALLNGGRILEARAFFIRSMVEYPDIADYALYRIFSTAKNDNDLRLAEKIHKDFKKIYSSSRWYKNIIYESGKMYADSGDHAKAVDILRKYFELFAAEQNIADAMLLYSEELLKIGKKDNAKKNLIRLWTDYPAAREADKAEDILKTIFYKETDIREYVNSGLLLQRCANLRKVFQFKSAIREYDYLIAHPKLLRTDSLTDAYLGKGEALEKLKEYKEAAELYQYLLKQLAGKRDKDIHALVTYKLANTYLQLGEDDSFLKSAKEVIDKYRKTLYGIKCAYLVFKFYKNSGEFQNALTYLDYILQMNNSPYERNEMLWESGFLSYLAGSYDEALKKFKYSAELSPEQSVQYSKSMYWGGKTSEKTGHAAEASYFYEKGIALNYYGKLCEIRTTKGSMPFSVSGVKNCDIKNLQNEQPDINEVWDKALSKIRWDKASFFLKRAKQLNHLDYIEDALAELQIAAKKENHIDIQKAEVLAKLLIDSGGYVHAVILMNRLQESERYKAMNAAGFAEIIYPLAFFNVVSKYSVVGGLDPFFVLAIMRQESLFNPDALSPAGAVGLMQLMPATAKRINKKNVERRDLLLPETNIRIGTAYLANLLNQNEDNVHYALSAYNAGEHKLKEWRNKFSLCEPEEFIERITFRETSDYVKKIVMNYLIYRSIYCADIQLSD